MKIWTNLVFSLLILSLIGCGNNRVTFQTSALSKTLGDPTTGGSPDKFPGSHTGGGWGGTKDDPWDDDGDYSTCSPQANNDCHSICHVPPGHPESRHVLWVGGQAVQAHLSNHSDYLGPCH